MSDRFSLSTTLANPVAESTKINLNSTNGHSAYFQWGGSPISPKNRSGSLTCLFSRNSGSSTAINKNTSIAAKTQCPRARLSKIDPRVYADVQSKGLTSRIVKYHDSGNNLRRSMSASNLYKVRQSPSGYLSKADLSYKATKQNVAVTRMAAPAKTIFFGDTLPSLMRSSSVLGFAKTNEELSCENRPIIHPPPTENDLAPTRSVLDVLKEISRKRINSDEIELSETTKKYCNREINDSVDSNHIYPALNVNVPQNCKRQREKFGYRQLPNAMHSTATAQPANDDQHSPEQVSKRRLCSYNNDITSSLSSSMIQNNKRKLIEKKLASERLAASGGNTSMSPVNGVDVQKIKIMRSHCDVSYNNNSKTSSCEVPLTPIPSTPLNHINSEPHLLSNSQIKQVPLYRVASEPTHATTKTIDTSNAVKPKLTLFNKNYDESNAKVVVERLPSNNGDGGDCANIPFVKPKKLSVSNGLRNAVIEKIQKSKLELMLAGLRNELYSEQDEVDTSTKNVENNVNKSIVIDEPNTTIQKPAASIIATSEAAVSSASLTFNTTTTIATTTKSSVVEINSAQTNVASSTTTSTAPLIMATSNKTPNTATIPTLGGFKFTPPTTVVSGNPTTVTVTQASPEKAFNPLIGQTTTQTTATTANSNITTTPTFNFGVSTATLNTPIVTSTVQSSVATLAPTFTFGTSSPSSISIGKTNTTTTTTATTTSAAGLGTFAFGANNNLPILPSAAPTTAVATTTPAAVSTGTFAFGVPSSPTAITSSASITNILPAAPQFNFGTSSTPKAIPSTTTAAGIDASTTTNPASSMFASVISTATTTPLTSIPSIPSFTTSLPSATQSQFVFNTSNAATPALKDNAIPSLSPFGSTPALVATTNSFAAPATNSFSFSAVSNTTTASSSTILPTGTFSSGTLGQKPIATTAPFAFSAIKPTASLGNSAFTFGSKPADVAAPTSSSTFAFGSPAPVTTAAAAVPSNSFTFGSGNNSLTSTPTFGSTTTSSANSVSVFGSATPTAANATPSAASIFGGVTGSPATPASNSLFGSSITNTPAQVINPKPMFGSPIANTPGPSVFGGASASTLEPQASAFGVALAAPPNTSVFSFGAKTESAPTSAFSFGGASATPAPSSTNLFGSPANTSTNAAKPNFNFGAAADTSKTIFGASSITSPLGGATFGSLAGASNSNQAKTFTFGSTNNMEAAPSGNIFGAASNTENKPASNSFSFGTTANINSQNKPTAVTGAFSFNATTANAASPPTAPFTFGSAANNVGSANKTFTFGSAVSNVSAPTAPFTFAGVNPAPNVGVAIPNGNIFAPPPSMAGPGDRPIRRATRRLQKS